MIRFLIRLTGFGAVVALFALFVVQGRHLLPVPVPVPVQDGLGLSADITDIRARQMPVLTRALAPIGADPGNAVYLRVFKEEAELELWIDTPIGLQLFRTYPICNYSGDLGPKLREGDHQAPEGFYQVRQGSLNPNSRFHLSFNLGFPNAYDRAHGRTGSFLMIHGACLSVGCYAMTDPMIEEIYVLVEAALRAGAPHVDVHAFPFRMTPARMAQARDHKWYGFWQQLEPAFAGFEATGQVPQITIAGGTYLISG